MLGTGYRSGYPENHILSEMETALSLSRVILADLNVANVSKHLPTKVKQTGFSIPINCFIHLEIFPILFAPE